MAPISTMTCQWAAIDSRSRWQQADTSQKGGERGPMRCQPMLGFHSDKGHRFWFSFIRRINPSLTEPTERSLNPQKNRRPTGGRTFAVDDDQPAMANHFLLRGD